MNPTEGKSMKSRCEPPLLSLLKRMMVFTLGLASAVSAGNAQKDPFLAIRHSQGRESGVVYDCLNVGADGEYRIVHTYEGFPYGGLTSKFRRGRLTPEELQSLRTMLSDATLVALSSPNTTSQEELRGANYLHITIVRDYTAQFLSF